MDEKELNKIPDTFERKEGLKKAITEFLLKESFILKNNLNERTLTHKLAECLQKYFSDYDVDCEYNRMINEDEIFITKTLNLNVKEIKSSDTKAVTVYPDIIIHKRGDNKDNLLIIEMKKKSNSQGKDFDIKKINAYIKQLKYKGGVYLEFNGNNISNVEWIKNG